MYNRYIEMTRRREMKERGLVHLIGMGDVQGKPAGTFHPGDIVLFNYGERYEVMGVEKVSPQFVRLTLTNLRDQGRESGRPAFHYYRAKATRLIAVGSRPRETAAG